MNEEGRGLFDEIKDSRDGIITFDNSMIRLFSSSIVLKSNENEEYRYFLNFESNKFNLEFLDLKTGVVSWAHLLDLIDFSDSTLLIDHVNYSLSWIQMIKYVEKNHFLLGYYSYVYKDNTHSSYDIKFSLNLFKLDDRNKYKKMNVESLKFKSFKRKISEYYPFNEKTRFYMIKTQKGAIFISAISTNNYLLLMKLFSLKVKCESYPISNIFEDSFHKLLFIKEEISLLGYYSDKNNPYYNIFYFIIY